MRLTDQPHLPMDLVIVTTRADLREVVSEVLAEIKPVTPPALADQQWPKGWLTQKECMAYLGVSKPTLARYRAEGKLPYSKIGGLLFYRTTDVEALLEAGGVRGRGDSRRRRT